MAIKAETRLLDRIHTIEDKYSKYIPADNKAEFEQDIYGIWKCLQLEFVVLEYIQKRLEKMDNI